MSKEGYLAIAIVILFALGVLALVLYLLLRKGPKVDRKKCEGCLDYSCPIAAAMEEKR